MKNFTFSACCAIVCALIGCAEPIPVHTRAEIVQNLGKKISVVGTYDVGVNGEHVSNDQIDVSLDLPDDILGFGRPPITTGSQVRASGTVERGVMMHGMYMDEDTLSHMRGRSGAPGSPGFVLRDAKISVLHAGG